MVSTDKTIEFKSPQTINEDFVTFIKSSKKMNKLLIQLKIPPKRKISSRIIDFFKNGKVSEGVFITHHLIKNNRIVGISHYESGDNGLLFYKEISDNSIIPLSSEFIQLDQNIIIKTSDNEYIYSVSSETMFQRVEKSDNFKLTAGKAYQINLT